MIAIVSKLFATMFTASVDFLRNAMGMRRLLEENARLREENLRMAMQALQSTRDARLLAEQNFELLVQIRQLERRVQELEER